MVHPKPSPTQQTGRAAEPAGHGKPPRRGPLFAVESHRSNRGQRQRVTKLFRTRDAADRYADHQRGLDREPVTIWTVDLPPWRLAGPSW